MVAGGGGDPRGATPGERGDEADAQPRADVEIWRLIADVHHPVHLHLVGFQVLSRRGRPPLPHDAGLKDTVSLRPGEAVEII